MSHSRTRIAKVLSENTSAIIVFVMVLLVLGGTVFVSSLFYNGVEDRVKALRGTASMLGNTISNPSDPRSSVEYWADKGLEYSKYLNNELSFDKLTFQDVNTQNFTLILRNLQGYTLQTRYFSDLAFKLAQDLVDEEHGLKEQGIEAKGTSYEALLSITNKLVNTTQQLEITYAEIVNSSEYAKIGGEKEMNNLRIKGIELSNSCYQTKALINAAIISLPAGNVNILAPFILVTVIYIVFLIFPWVLLLLFFLRKQKNLVEVKIKLFKDLKLDRFLEQPKMANKGEIGKEIAKQAFRTSEYLTSLILLTLINATLFYFFFYPHSTAGLAYLISTGGGVKAFANYVAGEATPLTFGFIGAYFFVIHMLLRRYFASDLNPKAYTFAVVRVLTVFIISVVLQLLSTAVSWTQIATSVTAFVVGIFPDVGVRWILRTANKLSGLKAPELLEKNPLTKIDGLNIWHEARFLEEKVENVQNLATASLDDLIINTNFCPSQLVDWIDQALLLIHVREQWTESFRAVGIRTATDLLSCTRTAAGKFGKKKVKNLVAAINTTQATISTGSVPANTAKETRGTGQMATGALQATSTPPQMTEEILETIVKTIEESPIIEGLWNYWSEG